jgi:hypothetical protein
VRERLTTFACALGALLLFATLFVRGGGVEQPSTRPTSTERASNGLRGASLWLQGEGIRTLSLRERFDTLTQRRDLAPTGNLLIVTTPVATAFRLTEASALNRWVGAGNTLLVLAALSDRPDWAAGGFVHSDLTLLTGLEFVQRGVPASGESAPGASKPARGPAGPRQVNARRTGQRTNPIAREPHSAAQLVPNGPHPYVHGVRTAEALSDYVPERWDVRVPRGGFVLALAHQQSAGQGVLWVRPSGAGTLIVSAFGSLFTNRALGLADNGRLLANIVSASLGLGGAVLFDDEHQGLSSAYDPARFYRDPRLYGTLALLVAVWLVWVLGGTRLRMPPAPARAPREAELVRATGQFLARVLRPAAAARRMFEHFFRRLQAGTRRGGDGGAPWDWLEHHPRLARADVQQLKVWYAAAYSERRVPLTRLHNLLVRTERRLAA